MLLKTLSLAGFKSFADRTRLDFASGVSVVVGPNGSGKSNLLDALAWVMGTQAVRSLRTERMEDVIFAGTATRPAMGRAEVTVTFDNSDRFLPLDLDEISMTRRLYRDGTSEYHLNGASCRLLDLHDLLSDGGVGRHQHVLVNQGQIGEILTARPEDHRVVIEEAAGITKHRSRRDRSLRRLAQTEIDVSRLGDLLDQDRRRLRPLKRQASAADRHQAVRDEIRSLRLWLGGEDLRRIRDRFGTASAEKADLDRAIAAAFTDLGEVADALPGLAAAAAELRRTLDRDTAAAARLETAAERFHRIAMVARERRHSLSSKLEGADERRADLEAERVHLDGELEAIEELAESSRRLAERREIELTALEDEERSLADQVQLPAEGVVANLRGDLRAVEVAAERDAREADSLRDRRRLVEARIEHEQAESAAIVAEIRDTDIAAGEAQAEYEEARDRRQTAQDRLEECEASHRDAQLAVAGGLARVEALEGALDGLGDPAARERTVAAAGVMGTVVSLLDVPEDVAPAVDAALGSWSDAFATDGPAALPDVVAALKSEGLGGVTLVVGHTRAGEPVARPIAAEWGADALVDRLGPGADAGLAHRLLGDVVIVEGWAAAWRLVGRHPEVRAVTPEGDVLSIHGMRLANADGAGHAALEAARVALEVAEREGARHSSHLVMARRAFETARHGERAALEVLEGLEARLAGHTEALARNGRSRAEGEAEVVRLDERARALAAAGATRDARLAGLRARLAEFEGDERERQAAWDALNLRRQEVARRRDEARLRRQEAAAALAGADERRRMVAARLATIAAETDALDTAPSDPGEIARLARVEEDSRRSETLVRGHLEALRNRQRSLRVDAAAAGDEVAEAEGRRRRIEAGMSDAKDRSSALAVELAELRVRDESVAEALRRDADATEAEALEQPAPDLPGFTGHSGAQADQSVTGGSNGQAPSSGPDTSDARREAARQELGSREAELRRMGPINPLAAAEYQELAGHVEMMEGQLADLEASRRELEKVIDALDQEMTARFIAAFDEISERFEENFALVFPGGRGRLRLTDEHRPLEGGVEIEAQPLGKKVGRLSLLSGGERSLAALAFLFAVFRARPSPFYVLDEVEAALDDANLRRFMRLVDTLRHRAQLVIITHQQQTMAAADILYGVTMEPAESSKVVSKRFDRARL